MKYKKVDAFNVVIICCAILLVIVTVVALLPKRIKAKLICNGMPAPAVSLLMGEPDAYDSSGPCYDLENGQCLQYDWNHYILEIQLMRRKQLINFTWVQDVEIVPFIPEPQASAKDILIAQLIHANINLKSGANIKLDANDFVIYYANHAEGLSSVIENNYLMLGKVSNVQREEVIYLLFLQSLTRYHSKSIVPTDYKSDSSDERPFAPTFIFAPGYEEAGYKTVHAYYEAIIDESCLVPEDAYVISYETQCISSLADPTGENFYETWLTQIETETE